MGYGWKPIDVLDINGIHYQSGKIDVRIKCPVCGSTNCYYNIQKGVWNDFAASCGAKGDSRSLHAILNGLSLVEAGKDLDRKLGIENAIEKRPERVVKKIEEISQSELAAPEVLDDTYRAFLNELSLSEKHKNNLLARGFSSDKIEALNYRSMPGKDEVDFFAICRRLQKDGHSFEGVPGFFQYYDGRWTFVYCTKGIIMPRVNHANQITGLQIRKDDDLRQYVQNPDGTMELEPKCSWFSSKGLNKGCGAVTALHYACDFKFNRVNGEYEPVNVKKGKVESVMLTEGIMKGDLTNLLQPNIPVIANQGVNCLKDLKDELEYLKGLGLENVIMGYDMDYKTNPNVQAALKKAKEIISSLGLQIKELDWETELTVNGNTVYLKGIDDYLAFHKAGVVPVIK